MSKTPANLRLISGQPYKDYELALLMKLTFSITANGECEPAKGQHPLLDAPGTYEDLDSPLVSPPSWDSDLMAFKPGTDVVVQGSAYSYGQAAQTVDAELKLMNVSRIVRVHGDRRVDWQGGNPVFTPAEPFEQMPIRYDRAFGGCDQANLAKADDPLQAELNKIQPGLRMDLFTDSHYPRNPCGRGYLIEFSRESSENMLLPNLEFPFDPVTPERLGLGHPNHWMSAPLPATFDWIDPSWFPRIAYLGLTPEYTVPDAGVKEISMGWAASSLLSIKSALKLGFHPTFQHGASPGLILRKLNPGSQMMLRNMFPDHPQRLIQLSKRVPKVEIVVSERERLSASPHLNAVVVMPDQDQVVEVWSARAKVSRPYGQNELDKMSWKIGWN